MSKRPVSYCHWDYLTPISLRSVALYFRGSSQVKLQSLTQRPRQRTLRPPHPETPHRNGISALYRQPHRLSLQGHLFILTPYPSAMSARPSLTARRRDATPVLCHTLGWYLPQSPSAPRLQRSSCLRYGNRNRIVHSAPSGRLLRGWKRCLSVPASRPRSRIALVDIVAPVTH